MANSLTFFVKLALADIFYLIHSIGAAGGCDSYGCNYRSYGAYMKGTFTLAAGKKLNESQIDNLYAVQST